MRKILTILFLFVSVLSFGQIQETKVKATEELETGVSFVYQSTDIPVLDLTYNEWSADSITWRKNYVNGDCYLRFSNDVKTTWAAINVCTGSGTGTSNIDTIFWTVDGVTDTITSGSASLYITDPDTVSGSSTNFQDTDTHTHELYIVLNDNENVNASPTDGQVLKWNSTSSQWEASNDLIAGGASGELTVEEIDSNPSVSNVTTIRVENGKLTDNGSGIVTIDFTVDPVNGEQNFYRTDTITVGAGDQFVTFSSPLETTTYMVDAYALYDDNTRQELIIDSLALDGFRALSILEDSAVMSYLAVVPLDSLLLASGGDGRVLASGTDVLKGYLNQKVDDTTITVTNNELTVINAPSSDSLVSINNTGFGHTLKENLASDGTPFIDFGADVTDLGNDSIAISAGRAFVKETNSVNSVMQYVTIPADTFYIEPDKNIILIVDCNGGTCQYKQMESIGGYFYSNWDETPFATVVNLGNNIIINDFKEATSNGLYKNVLSQVNFEAVRYLAGLSTTEVGTRQIAVTAGALLFANDFGAVTPINTSVADTFMRVYYDGGWTRVNGETTVDNTQYNDTASGLVNLTADYYANKWLYYVKDAPNYWVLLEGQQEYVDFVSAFEVTAPSFIPPELNDFYAGAKLVSKFVVQEGATNFAAVQNPFDDNYGVASGIITKGYTFTSQGILSGTYYTAGFYEVSATDANLTQASTTQTFGTANTAYAAHPFVVAGGAGTVDAGVVGLRVTGTRIEDDGTRTASYADTIITDITSQVLDQYTEAVKFIGTATYELITISGSPTTYSFDFNYGLAKYDDFGNIDFEVTGFECVGLAGATDANFNITLIHHNDEDWTYAATGFDITPTEIADLQTIYNTEYQLANGEYFAFKLVPVGYSSIIGGANGEGIIVRIVAGANNSVQTMNVNIGVRGTQ